MWRVGHRTHQEGSKQRSPAWPGCTVDHWEGKGTGGTLLTVTFLHLLPISAPLLDQFGTCQFCVYALR